MCRTLESRPVAFRGCSVYADHQRNRAQFHDGRPRCPVDEKGYRRLPPGIAPNPVTIIFLSNHFIILKYACPEWKIKDRNSERWPHYGRFHWIAEKCRFGFRCPVK